MLFWTCYTIISCYQCTQRYKQHCEAQSVLNTWAVRFSISGLVVNVKHGSFVRHTKDPVSIMLCKSSVINQFPKLTSNQIGNSVLVCVLVSGWFTEVLVKSWHLILSSLLHWSHIDFLGSRYSKWEAIALAWTHTSLVYLKCTISQNFVFNCSVNYNASVIFYTVPLILSFFVFI